MYTHAWKYFCTFVFAVSGTASQITSDPVDFRGDAKLAKLVEMGFEVERGRDALQQSQGDLEAACELLARAPSAASSGGGGFLSSLTR